MKALRTFPLGSSGGPDGITPQHIMDLLAGSTDDSLQQALVDFLNSTRGSMDFEGGPTNATSTRVFGAL